MTGSPDVLSLPDGTLARPPGRLESRRGRLVRIVDLIRIALLPLVVANLGRIPILYSGRKDAPILLNDIAVMALLAAGAFLAVRHRRLLLDRPACYALAFATVGGLSATLAVPRFGLSSFQYLFSIAYLFRWLAYFGVYLLVINFVRRDDLQRLWRALEAMVLLFAVFGIVQSAFLPGFAQLVYPEAEVYIDWDYQGRRLVSTFLDPNFAGGLLLFPLLVLLAQLSYQVKVPRWKLLLLLTALVLTVSRGSFLAFFAGIGIILLARGLSRRLVGFGAGLLLVVIPALPYIIRFAMEYGKFRIDPSAISRVLSWIRAWEIFADNPVLGIGFNTYGFVQEAYGYAATGRAHFNLDGGLLFIAVMTGGVGLVLYCAMLGSVVRRCRRLWRDIRLPGEERGLALGAAAVTIALLVQSLFLNSLLFPYLMEPLWILWGLTYLIARPHEGEFRAAPALRHPTLVSLGVAEGRA